MLTLATDAGDLDLLGSIMGVGAYRDIVSASDEAVFEGMPLRVLSIDGLIRAKRAVNRPKDASGLIELEAMRQARGVIDADERD